MSLETPFRCEAPDTALVETVVGGYVTWRAESAAVAATYETWARARGRGRAIAFADYAAALDREELAASEYQRVLRQAVAA